MLTKKLTALTALSLLAASTAASAQSTQSLGRAGPPAGHATASRTSQLDDRGNGYGIYIIGAIILGLAIWGIIELTKHDNGPSSP